MLSTDEVEVIAARLDVSGPELDGLAEALDRAELERASRLQDGRRREYVATRGFLRELLGKRLRVPPQDVPLRTDETGKLFAPGAVLFNVTHSTDLAVFAFARNRRVGVDVELLRPVADLTGVVELALAPSEAAELDSVPTGERRAAFFACWTRKEAYLKASGNGLGSPRDVAVSLRPGAPARVVSVKDAPAEPGRWTLTSFEPAPGYVGAVAVERAA